MNISSVQVWLRAGLAATLAVSITLLSGCGSSKKDGRISGKVMYGNEPLGGGTIILLSTEEGKSQASTLPPIGIGVKGNYESGGIPPGEYYVGVETDSIKQMAGGAGGMYNMGGMKPPPGKEVNMPQFDTSNMPKYVEIPAKYKDPKQSGLPKMTVQKGNNPPHDIIIPKG
jgi:hypothetical protein